MHVFKTDGGARFHSIIITVGNDDYISKFPDVLWKTESVCKLFTVGFLHEYLSKQKSILLKNLTGKKAATTWTETPLSCECAPGVKNSAGQSGLQVIKEQEFSLTLIKKMCKYFQYA